MSGVGDYRYVDCVAINGGKQEALEYIRTLYNIPLTHCMAAGDSGNDTLMLEGMFTCLAVNACTWFTLSMSFTGMLCVAVCCSMQLSVMCIVRSLPLACVLRVGSGALTTKVCCTCHQCNLYLLLYCSRLTSVCSISALYTYDAFHVRHI